MWAECCEDRGKIVDRDEAFVRWIYVTWLQVCFALSNLLFGKNENLCTLFVSNTSQLHRPHFATLSSPNGGYIFGHRTHEQQY